MLPDILQKSAAPEMLQIHLLDHRQRPAIAFGLALRQMSEMTDLRCGEQ
jgi:hypothetical protein